MDIQGVEFPYELPEFPHTVVANPEDVPAILESHGNGTRYAFDAETTGLHYITDKLAGLSLATKEHAWYFHGDWVVNAVLPWFEEKMNNPEITWIAHNAKFDMHFLARHGIRPKKIYDTEIAQYLLEEEQSLKLKDLGKLKLGIQENLPPDFKALLHLAKRLKGAKRLDQVNIYDVPLEVLGPYGALDSRMTFDLAPITEQGLRDEGLWQYYQEQEIPFIYTILDMERRGVLVDREWVAELETKFKALTEEYEAEWVSKVGDVNPRSPQQIIELLYNKLGLKTDRRTDSGNPSTDALTLKRLVPTDKTGTVELLLKYREVSKLESTYIVPLRDRLHNGRIYTNFNRTGTVTGRLSSSGDINLQNIPLHTELGAQVRKAFIAEPGHLLMDVDYSQIELRILAHFCRDESLVRAFYWGADPHQLTANRMGVPRYVGKTLNFLIIYGGGPIVLGDQLEKIGKPRPTVPVARRWLQEYNRIYPAITPFKEQVMREAKQYGYVTTIGGRHRHADLEALLAWDIQTSGREERQLFNTKIQGSAGDVINYAMVDIGLNERLASLGVETLLQVHDELVFTVPEENVEEGKLAVKAHMEAVEETFNISVPILAEPAAARNWVEAKD